MSTNRIANLADLQDPPSYLPSGAAAAWTHAAGKDDLETLQRLQRTYAPPDRNGNGEEDKPPDGPLLLRWEDYRALAEAQPSGDYVIPGLFRRGQSSLLVGEPKAGKSTLARKIAVAVAKGGSVLDREIEQAQAVYMPLQEHPQHVVREMERIDPDPGVNLFLHNPSQPMAWDRLRGCIPLIGECRILIVDMLADFKAWEDGNNYVEMKRVVGEFTRLARETNVHVLLLHHGNKAPVASYPTARVHGSAAIAGETDVVASIHRDPKKGRVFQAEGRGIAYQEVRLGGAP